MQYILPFLLACQLTAASLSSSTRSTGLDWQPCPDINQIISNFTGVKAPEFDCANLTVPLDYTNPNSTSPLTLNLFRYNATQQPALGSVIVNFGGPGGSGAENLPAWGRKIGENIGPQWNLITWDPRGTGKTIPFDCKINSTSLSSPNNKRDLALISANLTDYFINGGWDAAGETADACFAAMNDTGRFVSTASTAKDVMAIVDALDEDGMLRYWGWSYGTALGSYLAALFPDRIERMVLDGNLNPLDYQSGTYRDTANDLDKAFQGFLQECLNNKDSCSLAKFTNASSTDDIITVLNQAIQPFIGNLTNQQNLAIYAGVTVTIVQGLYYPSTWPDLADTITSILKGQAPTSSGSTVPDPYNLGTPWSAFGIRGADAIWQTSNIDEYLPQVQYDATKSSFGVVYINLWPSARWKITPPDRYKGSFNTTTKHPILYINGEYDPVTPIIGAYNASQGFKGSVVLAHKGYGHGIVVDPSTCVAQYAQAYFKDGTLPPQGTVCNPDNTPWQLAAGGAAQNNSSGGSNSSGIVPSSAGSKTGIQGVLLITVALAIGASIL